jgi:hypothetical protein
MLALYLGKRIIFSGGIEMNRYYGYFRDYDGNRGSDSVFADFEDDVWETHAASSKGPLPLRLLPWVGGMAIGLGLLIILFPMLLVIAVAAVFFSAGVTCLGLWWQLRDRGNNAKIDIPLWNRARHWVRQLLEK